MSVKISHKIVGYSVANAKAENEEVSNATTQEDLSQPSLHEESNIIQMHEKVERPETLIGSTYKIKTPVSEHAFYITINDILLNAGTAYEKRRPFEIFINSKNMDHYQWISGLTLIISAVFRKGGDINFLVHELKSVFDPKGGYFKKRGKFMPSLVAEIGEAIESHLKTIGMIEERVMDEHQKKLIAEKRREFAKRNSELQDAENSSDALIEGAVLCAKCNTTASVLMDGCMTCLNCGDSKCG